MAWLWSWASPYDIHNDQEDGRYQLTFPGTHAHCQSWAMGEVLLNHKDWEWSRGAFLKKSQVCLTWRRADTCCAVKSNIHALCLCSLGPPASISLSEINGNPRRYLATAQEPLCSKQEMPSAGAPLPGITRYPTWYNSCSVGTLPSLCAAVLLPSACVKALEAS